VTKTEALAVPTHLVPTHLVPTHLDEAKQSAWLISLGYELTISARGAYPYETTPAVLQALMGCNEMQHQITQRLAHLHTRDAWPVDSFFDTLAGFAKVCRLISSTPSPNP
jgi:hypothetical protein